MIAGRVNNTENEDALLSGDDAEDVLGILQEMPKDCEPVQIQNFLAFVDIALASQNKLLCDPMSARQAFLGTNASDIAWGITNLKHYAMLDTPLSVEEQAAAARTSKSGTKSQRKNKRVRVACKTEDKRKIENCWKRLRVRILKWEGGESKEDMEENARERAALKEQG